MRLPDCVLDELAKDDSLTITERGLYMLAWAHDPPTVKALAELAHVDRGTAARACRHLAERGWMKMVPHGRENRPAPLIPRASQIAMAHDLEEEYDLVIKKGELLAAKRVDWSLRRDQYVANARPKFLKNPQTGKPLEYDTYDPKAAFATEFNGSQHYKESSRYSEEEVNEQKTHDLLKQSLSARNGVTLLTFTWEDLRPGVLEARLDLDVPHLKRGYVDLDGPYMKTLNRICENYVAKVERAEREAALRDKAQ